MVFLVVFAGLGSFGLGIHGGKCAGYYAGDRVYVGTEETTIRTVSLWLMGLGRIDRHASRSLQRFLPSSALQHFGLNSPSHLLAHREKGTGTTTRLIRRK